MKRKRHVLILRNKLIEFFRAEAKLVFAPLLPKRVTLILFLFSAIVPRREVTRERVVMARNHQNVSRAKDHLWTSEKICISMSSSRLPLAASSRYHYCVQDNSSCLFTKDLNTITAIWESERFSLFASIWVWRC